MSLNDSLNNSSNGSATITCLSSSTSYELDATRAAFDTIMLFLVVATNVGILAIVGRRWSTDGMPLCNVTSSLLIVNLSAADALVGVFSVFYFLPRYYCPLAEMLGHCYPLCILRFALIITAHLASGYTLVAIAADRYFAVCHALNYRDIVSSRRSVSVIAGIWVMALAGGMLLFAWTAVDTYADSLCVEDKSLPLSYTIVMGLFGQVVILVSTTLAHWRVHRAVVRMRQRSAGATGGLREHDERIGTRASRVLGIILSVYIVSWAPFMLTLIIKTCGVAVPVRVFEMAASLVNFNYLVNPFLYAYNNRSIQKAIHRCIRSLKRKTVESWQEANSSFSISKQ